MNEEYSPYKIVHHIEKIKQIKNGFQTVPLQVQIIPSNKCNQRCSFCAYRMKGYLSNETFDDKEILDYDKILEILDDICDMGIGAVQYTGGGEPLVAPYHYKMFEETFKRNIELALVTNGMALKEKTCDLLGDSSWVRVSVDCSNENTYHKIRTVSPKIFGKVIKNIKDLVKYKRINTIGIGFVVNKDNYKEIYEAAVMFKDLGVDNFRISAAFNPIGLKYFDNIYEKAFELSKKAEELNTQDFTVFNLFNDRVFNLFQGIQNYNFCPTKELLTYIGADYNVYTCCTLAYNKKGAIGSIKDQSFRDLWYSEEKQLKFSKHNPIDYCKHPCMYEGKNDFINYCIKKNPKHINFI